MSHHGKVGLGVKAVFLCALFFGHFSYSTDSHAQWEDAPLKIVVLPFEGKGTGGLTAAEAMELELEMVSQARLISSRGLRVQLSQLSPASRFSDTSLSRLMRDFSIDILIRGERVATDSEGPQLKIVAYAKDGLPRWISTVPLPSDPVFTASEVGKAFIEELEVWRDLPPVTDRRVYQKLSEYDDVDFENNSDLDKNNAQRKKKRDVARTSPDWSQESELPSLKERKERPRKRRRYFTDDRAKSRVLKSDNTRRKSFWGLNTGMGSWQYQIEGLSEAFVNNVGASAYPSVGAELSWWFSPMVGLDIKMQGSILEFEFNADTGLSILPAQFSSNHFEAASSLQILLWEGEGPHPSFVALRGGYFLSSATTEPQTVNGLQTTLVPGWLMHAPTVGAALRVGNGRGGVMGFLRADVIPWGIYQESPDNPGSQVQPAGWVGATGLRYQSQTPFYLEISVESHGLSAQFDGVGDRRAADGGPWQDGRVLNWKVYGLLRLGTSF